MSDPNGSSRRFNEAKHRLTGLLEEALARLEEIDAESYTLNLLMVSLEAAMLAAQLGFENPPLEHIGRFRGIPDPALEANPGCTHVSLIRAHDPRGLLAYDAYVAFLGDRSESSSQSAPNPLSSESRAAALRRVATALKQWQRTVDKLDIRDVEYSKSNLREKQESLESFIFNTNLEHAFDDGRDVRCDDPRRQLAEARRRLLDPRDESYQSFTENDRKRAIALIDERLMELADADDGGRGEAESQTLEHQGSSKKRIKREVAHPLIATHLMKRPHDTAKEVARAVSCSIGVVSESPAWKMNRRRLQDAKRQGIDPTAVKLDEKTVNAVGGSRMTQLHDHRQQADKTDAELDRRDKELFARIGEFEKSHPQATTQQIAAGVGCTAGDVERRQATLNQLAAEQNQDHQEDIDVEDPLAKRGLRRKWGNKQV
ncbi:MAG: hypothetical protein JSU63_07540 [Phycisphaerales bacterium]|nr:MAG: hypothetical protein JSU63_07540 [Phycisphaerales bacterium]